MYFFKLIACTALIFSTWFERCVGQFGRSGNKQERRNRAKPINPDSSVKETHSKSPIEAAEPALSDEELSAKARASLEIYCPRDCDNEYYPVKRAIEAYWLNDIVLAEACACNAILKSKEDSLAEAIRYECMHSKYMPSAIRHFANPGMSPSPVHLPKREPPVDIMDFDILGPLPVGKLEVDGDPSFSHYHNTKTCTSRDKCSLNDANYEDPVTYLLSLPSKLSGGVIENPKNTRHNGSFPIYTELLTGGVIKSWQEKRAKGNGQLDVQFPNVAWNELVNGLSTTAVMEFQAWVRSNSYVSVAGTYLVSCQGSHTVYIRNNNNTHVLNADVYSSGGVNNGLGNPQSVMQSRVVSTVYLKIGIVGIVIPLRGATIAGLSCQIKLTSATEIIGSGSIPAPINGISSGSATSIVTYPLKYVPELLAWEYVDSGVAGDGGSTSNSGKLGGESGSASSSGTGMGLLLSDVFLLPVLNTLSSDTITVDIKLELSPLLSTFLSNAATSGVLPNYMVEFLNTSLLAIRPLTTGASGRSTPPGMGTGVNTKEPVSVAEVKIPPGQTMAIPLQLYAEKIFDNVASSKSPSVDIFDLEGFDGEVEVMEDLEEEESFSCVNGPSGSGCHTEASLTSELEDQFGLESLLFLPCSNRKSYSFFITLTPSRGSQMKIPFELHCRKKTESVLISYQDYDGSIAQAAVLFPLLNDYYMNKGTEQHRAHSILRSSLINQTENGRGGQNQYGSYPPNGSLKKIASWMDIAHLELSLPNRIKNKQFYNSNPCQYPFMHKNYPVYPGCFPMVLTLHGSGSAARNQADAYKRKIPRTEQPKVFSQTVSMLQADSYVFGVENFFVVAPSRFGAHNWETVGSKSVNYLADHFGVILSKFKRFLPQVRAFGHVIAGHSMGGHGAMVAATSIPNSFTCASIASSWMRKENYGSSNNFQHLDVDDSLTDIRLKMLFELLMAEHHIDRVLGNMQHMHAIHVRVGKNDMTTHPWYSRRLHRMLRERFGTDRTQSLNSVATTKYWLDDEEEAVEIEQEEQVIDRVQDQRRRKSSLYSRADMNDAKPKKKVNTGLGVVHERGLISKIRRLLGYGSNSQSSDEEKLAETDAILNMARTDPILSYEEVPNKQHWWWDTDSENDGGVLNDLTMRKWYRDCHMNSVMTDWNDYFLNVKALHHQANTIGSKNGCSETEILDGMGDYCGESNLAPDVVNLKEFVYNTAEYRKISSNYSTSSKNIENIETTQEDARILNKAVSGKSKAYLEKTTKNSNDAVVAAGVASENGRIYGMTALERRHKELELQGIKPKPASSPENSRVGSIALDADKSAESEVFSTSDETKNLNTTDRALKNDTDVEHLQSPVLESPQQISLGKNEIELLSPKQLLASSGKSHHCHSMLSNDSPYTIVVTNVASQNGIVGELGEPASALDEFGKGACGLLVMQQIRTLEPSRINIQCNGTLSSTAAAYSNIVCEMNTHNVKRLRVYTKTSDVEVEHEYERTNVFPDIKSLIVNGHLVEPIGSSNQQSVSSIVPYLEICIFDKIGKRDVMPVGICTDTPLNPLLDKSAYVTGPIREIYSKPIIVIYGTIIGGSTGDGVVKDPYANRRKSSGAGYETKTTKHNSKGLSMGDIRIITKEYASYLANSIYIAYDTTVTVMSDVEYLSYIEAFAVSENRYQFPNVVIVGNPKTNLVMKLFHEQQNELLKGANGNRKRSDLMQKWKQFAVDQQLVRRQHRRDNYGSSEQSSILLGNIPLQFLDVDSQKSNSVGFTFTRNHIDAIVSPSKFDLPEHSVMFSFPIQMQSLGVLQETINTFSSLAMCIHSNSYDFVSLSRWSWPTVPPMVRAPFELNILDYVVLDSFRIFSHGYGSVLGAGFYDSNWRYDKNSPHLCDDAENNDKTDDTVRYLKDEYT